jgi:hypothetical protein
MNDREERRRQLREKAREAARMTDRALEGELVKLRGASPAQLEQLRPRVTDTAAYEQLLAAVGESTRQNESLALLQARLRKLGQQVLEASSEAARLLA